MVTSNPAELANIRPGSVRGTMLYAMWLKRVTGQICGVVVGIMSMGGQHRQCTNDDI